MDLVSRSFALTALLLMTSVSCAEQQNSALKLKPQGIHNGQLQLLSAETLTILNEQGQPLSGATVMVGFENGNPFAGNILQTDANGIVHVPADWTAPLPVTVTAPGYITSTVPNLTPASQTLQLIKTEPATEFEVRGTAKNFPRLVTDGKVDFALMIPALSRENLLAFDLSTVISPKVDTIEIIGNEISLPSNISLPRQTENFIFPIELNKPEYRVYLRNPGTQTLTATHGQFPLQRVVNDIRAGKSMFELINHFNFTEGGQTSLDVQGDMTGQDVAVNQTPFNAQVSVKAPVFPAGQQMVNLALVEQNGSLIPTDLKRLNSGQTMNLKSFNSGGLASMFSFLVEAASNMPAYLIEPHDWFSLSSALKPGWVIRPMGLAEQDFTRLSFSFLPATGGVSPQFLSLIAKPVLNGNVMTLEVPTAPAGLTPLATYLTLSEVEKITTGNVVSEKRTRLWEVWSNEWLAQVELPKVDFNKRADRTYRWEVMFMARPTNFVGSATPGSRVDLNAITHVTRNALDI